MPCSRDTKPPIVKINTATTSVQKYSSFPLPRGYTFGLLFLDCLMPNQSKNWLNESTKEWKASEKIALEHVITATTEYITTIKKVTEEILTAKN